MYSMRFDMRAPDFGAAATELYEAAVEMCAWAETRGGLAAVLCEHHDSPDGFLPTPLILGTAIAARTKQLMMTLTVIVALYDPVRLAEEFAVLDIIGKGAPATCSDLAIGLRNSSISGSTCERADEWPTKSSACCADSLPARWCSTRVGESG
jgi:Luciferase-like monooxygenase